jgi:mono/diheme cytochrome c family protein
MFIAHYNTSMRTGTALLACLFATVLSVAASAQYAGWTIPSGGKEQKSPLKPSADVVKKGKAVFTSKCQKCHGPAAKGDGPDSDPKSPAADLTDELRYELHPEGVLYYKVWNGHPPQMPAFKSQLSSDEVWQVVAYVMSLRKPQ